MGDRLSSGTLARSYRGYVMKIAYVLIWGSMLVLGATAVLAFVWAVRNGEMRDFGEGARSIFDSDEPVGRPTDTFPDERG
jgi:nitrogen fixation-related uncharacterized protein